jgi:hypothetical protein
MLRYWQARGLLEQRPLSEELRQSMLTQSTPEQWRAKGFELFNKGLYGDAKRCFGKAGGWLRTGWLAGWRLRRGVWLSLAVWLPLAVCSSGVRCASSWVGSPALCAQLTRLPPAHRRARPPAGDTYHLNLCSATLLWQEADRAQLRNEPGSWPAVQAGFRQAAEAYRGLVGQGHPKWAEHCRRVGAMPLAWPAR